MPDPDPRAPATEYDFADGGGQVGFIASVSRPFCLNCNRLRLTADGKLRYCLFAIEEDDVKALMRSGAPDEEIAALVRRNVAGKWEGHEINSHEVRRAAAADVLDRRIACTLRTSVRLPSRVAVIDPLRVRRLKPDCATFPAPDRASGGSRTASRSATWGLTASRCATRSIWRGSARWSFRRRGRTSGSALRRTATCRPSAGTRRAASSIAIIRSTGRRATRRNSRRMIAFGTVLALIRRRVQQDLDRRGLPKEKVLATVVRLLETTFIRVGNDEYAKENESFGLTTMRDRHVRIAGAKLLFRFRGKSGQDHSIELTDQRLARIVKAVPGPAGVRAVPVRQRGGRGLPHRFRRRQRLHPRDLRAGLHGQGFPHLGRHGAGRARASRGRPLHRARRAGKRIIVDAIKSVAKRLGNRPATCRKYYIHPAIIDAYSDGSLFPAMQQGEAAECRVRRAGPASGGIFGDGADRRVSAEAGEGGVNPPAESRPAGFASINQAWRTTSDRSSSPRP